MNQTQDQTQDGQLIIKAVNDDTESGKNKESAKKDSPSFCKVFCACNVRKNFKSIFQRPPTALKALDGVRAMAILWVYALHVGYFWGGYTYCARDKWYYPAFLNLMMWGDYGVDIFFVLSGFLIAYILLKECEKYGPKIDVWNFYRGRILRLYPAMFPVCIIIAGIFQDLYAEKWKIIYTLIFVNNYVGPKTHLWSVAVEIQMYLISPFLVQWMYNWKRENVWLIPFVICLISTIFCFATLAIGVPELWTNEDWVRTTFDSAGGLNGGQFYDLFIYRVTHTRIAPYGFGMHCAYLYLQQVKDGKHDVEQAAQKAYLNKASTKILEVFSFVVMLAVSYIGGNPTGQVLFKFPAWFKFIQAATFRQILGLSLSYLVHLVLNPAIESVPWYRPSKFMYKWLSMDFWIPFANLSYSFYLLHVFPMVMFVFNSDFLSPDFGMVPVGRYDVTCWPDYYAVLSRWFVIFFYGFFTSMLWSMLSYVFLEKPSIDAKRVFKNKYAE